MNRYFLLTITLYTSPLWANGYFEDERLNKKQIEMIEQRMEEKPTSTAIGGSRGGDQETEKKQDDKARHTEEKQRQLYEWNGYYRRGL